MGVVVGVAGEAAGRHGGPVGVEHAPGRLVDPADVDDAVAAHRDVGGTGRGPGAVDDPAAAYEEVEGHAAFGTGMPYMSSALRPNNPARASGSRSALASRSSSTTPGYLASLWGKSDAQMNRSAPHNGPSTPAVRSPGSKLTQHWRRK